jgi:hypothetical protein
METVATGGPSLFRFRYPRFLDEDEVSPPPPPPIKDEELERDLREFTKEWRSERSTGVRPVGKVLQDLFEELKASEKRAIEREKVRDDRIYARIEVVEHAVRGVQARVTVLETSTAKRPASLPPAKLKEISHYEKSETSNVFRLTDYEMHELHENAKTYVAIKAFVRAVSIPVSAAILVALLAWVGVHLWHSSPAPAPQTPTFKSP